MINDDIIAIKDGMENPILVLQRIYEYMRDTNYKSRFEWRSTQPTLERTIAKEGVLLYERI